MKFENSCKNPFGNDFDKAYDKLFDEQKEVYKCLMEKRFVGIDAPPGTGKTLTAFIAGFSMLKQGLVDRIIYIRTIDDRTQQLGYVKGSLEEKEDIYMLPAYDAITEMGITPEYFMNDESLILRTDTNTRGINFKRSFVIFDEMQNGSFFTMKLLLTRLHDTCTVAFIGDKSQCDNKRTDESFSLFLEHMAKYSGGCKCELSVNHRGSMSQWAQKLTI